MTDWVYFDYDALRASTVRRRPTPPTPPDPNDAVPDRSGTDAQERDELRQWIEYQQANMSWVAWAIRAHMSYVSRFNFMISDVKDDRGLEREVDQYLRDWMEDPRRVHVRYMHSVEEMVMFHELGKILDGDDFIAIQNGRFIGIPGERVKKPQSGIPRKYENRVTSYGFVFNPDGSPEGVTVVDPDTGKFVEFIPWDKLYFSGYQARHDQIRGISPLVSAITDNEDLKENNTYTLLKIKFSAFFGAIIKREANTPLHELSAVANPDTGRTEYKFDLKPGMQLELDPGDSIEFPESKTPSSEYLNFADFMLRVALKALDIPYTWFDSKRSSYNAMRQEQNLYQMMAYPKQLKNKRAFKWMLQYGLLQAVANGDIPSVYRDRIRIDVLPYSNPFLDPQREIPAAAAMVSYGLSSRRQFMREHNYNPDRVMAEIMQEQEEMKKMPFIGVAQPGQTLTSEVLANAKSAQQ